MSTKLHAAVDRRGRLLRLVLTPGQRGDSPQAAELLSNLQRGTVGHVIADAAYDSDDLRAGVCGICGPEPASNPTRCGSGRGGTIGSDTNAAT